MDGLDKKILKSLQNNGRKKNTELARELNVSPSTMLDRVRRIEEQGIVRGYRADIDPDRLGLTVQAFISVNLDRHEADYIRKFEKGIHSIPYIRACYHLSGRFDYLLHVAVRDLNRLGDLVKHSIAAIPGVGRTETFLVFSDIKPDVGWPIEDDGFDASKETEQGES